jgi:hypothetical protein
MNQEEPVTHVPGDGISRRRMLKRIGVGAAVAWSAPILTSIKAPAFAQYGSPCDPGAQCDVNMPCNFAIDCQNSGGTCNCWVLTDRSGCWCGPFDPCSNHAPCSSNADCASGERCIENCCGRLCYAPCGAPAGGGSGPRGVRT